MFLTLKVFDSSTKAAIPGADIVFSSPEKLGKKTDATGKAVFTLSAEGFYTYTITASGYNKYEAAIDIVQGVNLLQERYLQKQTAPPIPIPGGYLKLEDIGTSCVLNQFDMGGQVAFEIRTRDGLRIVASGEYDRVKQAGQADARCHVPPPPPPVTTDEINQKVDALGSVINGVKALTGDIKKSVESAIESIKTLRTDVDKLLDFFNNVDEWLIERQLAMKEIILSWVEGAFIAIIERVLEHEKKD